MKKYLPTIVIAIIVAVIAFYGGLKYGESKTMGSSLSQGGQAFQGGSGLRRGNFTGANGGGFVSGQVLSVNPQGFTVQTRAGSSQIVLVASSTAVMKAVAGTTGDITSGQNVTVIGTANSDGSYTAQSVQIRAATSTQSGQ